MFCLIFFYCALSDQSTFSVSVGSFKLTLLQDGTGQGNPSVLINATDARKNETIPNGFVQSYNAFLLQTGSKNILFDTGLGTLLVSNLNSLGVSPGDIDEIFITHMHGDHTGGLQKNNTAVFPNATLYISSADFSYFPNTNVDLYLDRLQTFNSPVSILSNGITQILASGHTPGHTVYLIQSNNDSLLIVGDLIHVLPYQIRYPETAVTYDVDPFQAITTRLQILENVSNSNIRVAGMHLPFPAIGLVSKSKDGIGYVFTESPPLSPTFPPSLSPTSFPVANDDEKTKFFKSTWFIIFCVIVVILIVALIVFIFCYFKAKSDAQYNRV